MSFFNGFNVNIFSNKISNELADKLNYYKDKAKAFINSPFFIIIIGIPILFIRYITTPICDACSFIVNILSGTTPQQQARTLEQHPATTPIVQALLFTPPNQATHRSQPHRRVIITFRDPVYRGHSYGKVDIPLWQKETELPYPCSHAPTADKTSIDKKTI